MDSLGPGGVPTSTAGAVCYPRVMPGSRVVRLRQGSLPDTSRALLDPQRARSGVATPTPTQGGGGTGYQPPGGSGPTKATGAQLIRASGGSQQDINAWRKLTQKRRDAIRGRVQARGGSLTKAIRKTVRLKQQRR